MAGQAIIDLTKAKVVKAQISVLDSGHCLQCFKPFTDLHDNTLCTYHKGYAVSQSLSNKRVWSCCDQEVEEIDAHLVHGKTGCTTSRVHNWRTHKKAKGKDWEKMHLNKNGVHT
ncbi:uncharacterized protein LOC132721158 [Ruditapes philippinarum]|uniref:uncharacterized protein LOC132721158 n=1 Tax=Ruditapes philippinarum TaxID=129788 RepID=UPI00295BBDDB|nr:uncharacterized protein LOC132721158 [Ruditapes philippinarum]